MNDDAFLKKGFLISTDKTLLDINVIHYFLDKQSYWGKGISRQTVETSIQNSLCFGVYQQQKQVGFARLITDFATFAYLCDVFILPDYRKSGLSKWLMQTIRNQPDLQNLRRWALATADAHGLYEQFGFKKLKSHDRWMEIFNPGLQQLEGTA
ncbi:GNAT family N-acetyltransferase [Mucilaginibacter sp. HMF7410]|uniref:GNAT family N-acetyltransferase n=2 Tax=Mucilaginibacter arboris TaxID=2682090 RepID=A0A7K1SXZ7_9SPHI|nr:GNAT family N-acetyltransferase [Mucilaginibacter arboris]